METTAGAGTCTAGALQATAAYTNAATGQAYSAFGIGFLAVESITFSTGVTIIPTFTTIAVGASSDYTTPKTYDFYASGNITLLVNQTTASTSTCSPFPVVSWVYHVEAY